MCTSRLPTERHSMRDVVTMSGKGKAEEKRISANVRDIKKYSIIPEPMCACVYIRFSIFHAVKYGLIIGLAFECFSLYGGVSL